MAGPVVDAARAAGVLVITAGKKLDAERQRACLMSCARNGSSYVLILVTALPSRPHSTSTVTISGFMQQHCCCGGRLPVWLQNDCLLSSNTLSMHAACVQAKVMWCVLYHH
eukprot:GHUV01026253.1.p1 GENE.GHUV01026253.1~~GHUV01026253.1.p1  ORF type:complete len:111 (-),score=16.31 GHUV01026253.1:589-921(-)